MLSDVALRRARVGAQLLHRPNATVDAVVRHLLALQAQDIAAAPLAVRARSRAVSRSDLTAARADRSIVRTWGPRGTLHLVAADDLAWLTGLFGPLRRAQAMRRLSQLGVTGTEADLVRVTARALADQGPLTKAEFGDRLATLGQLAAGQGVVYLAFLGAAHGQVVLGPDRGNKPTYVHAADWLGAPVDLHQDHDTALAELARRYLRARGPTAPADLAGWAGVTGREATKAFSLAAADLTEVTTHNGPLWRLTRGGSKPATVAVALVPAFDEYLLSWRDRELILDPTHAKAILPGGGILHSAIVADGRIVGTWRARPELFASETVDQAALAAEFADVEQFRREPQRL